jgi:hypothetical protein
VEGTDILSIVFFKFFTFSMNNKSLLNFASYSKLVVKITMEVDRRMEKIIKMFLLKTAND